MRFSKTLLAGAAICALTSVTALASPGIHVFMNPGAKAIHLKNSHFKTNVGQSRKGQQMTFTATFPGTLNVSTAYKSPIPLPAIAFINTSVTPCVESGKSKLRYSKDKHAKIRPFTSVGHTATGALCPNTSFTFYGGLYTLTDKKAKSDSFVGTLTDKQTSSGYNLKLIEDFQFTLN